MTTVLAEPQDTVRRPHAEQEHQAELALLAAADDRPRPPGWRLSPWAVVTYLLGGTAPDGTAISPKYVGYRRLSRPRLPRWPRTGRCCCWGAGNREVLGVRTSGRGRLRRLHAMVQCTAGTDEDPVSYGWNYARLIAEGPSREAMVKSPVMRAMAGGQIVRFEELTRMPSDVQDALITVLSEKTLPIPEFGTESRRSGVSTSSPRLTIATAG